MPRAVLGSTTILCNKMLYYTSCRNPPVFVQRRETRDARTRRTCPRHASLLWSRRPDGVQIRYRDADERAAAARRYLTRLITSTRAISARLRGICRGRKSSLRADQNSAISSKKKRDRDKEREREGNKSIMHIICRNSTVCIWLVIIWFWIFRYIAVVSLNRVRDNDYHHTQCAHVRYLRNIIVVIVMINTNYSALSNCGEHATYV